jgi:hypothetical protein
MFDSSPAFMHGLCFWLPVPIRRLVSPGCRRGLAEAPIKGAGQVGSRACSFSTCSWLLDYAGPAGNSRYRSRQCGLPVASTRSAPELRFSKLNSRPVDASVYASPGTSRHPAQDSRSRWFATPFLWGSFIPDCTPVYPDDCTCLRAWLGSRCRYTVTEPVRNTMSFELSTEAGSTTPGSEYLEPGVLLLPR